MTFSSLGKRIKHIRSEMLDMSQGQLAAAVKTSQALISRLEIGEGGTIPLLCSILSYFETQGIRSYYIFYEPFSPNLLSSDGRVPIEEEIPAAEQLLALLDEIRKTDKRVTEVEKGQLIYLLQNYLDIKSSGK